MGRLDPVVLVLARWADENPEAMRRLVSEPALQAQMRAAIEDVVGGEARPAHG